MLQTDCGQPAKPPHEWPALTSPGLVWHRATGLPSTFQPRSLLARGEWLTVCVKRLSQSDETARGPRNEKNKNKKKKHLRKTVQDKKWEFGVALSAAEATAAEERDCKSIYPKCEHVQRMPQTHNAVKRLSCRC